VSAGDEREGHRRRPYLAPLLVAIGAFPLSLVPIRSYDAFWHLATGRWILEHRALPLRDPFGLASTDAVWRNGEWLFQVVLYGLHSLGGEAALSVARAVAVALLAAWLFARARGETSFLSALLLTVLAIYGADARLAVRPEIAGIILAAFVVGTVLREPTPFRIAAIAAATIGWVNLHPSALLAPALVAIAACGRLPFTPEKRREAARYAVAIVAASGALLINPWGWHAITGPLALARTASSDLFVNSEWLPSNPAVFPLLYVAMGGGMVVLLLRRDRETLARGLLFLFFSLLAIRYVRNQGFFFALLPLLLAPAMPRLRARSALGTSALAASIAALAGVSLLASRGAGIGVDPDRFPVRASDQLVASGLHGNVYNPDQFGGYLIWRLYPERRVLTDGRNELYLNLLRELPRAFGDSRRWGALLARYEIDLAVQEYRAGRIAVTDARTGRVEARSPSHVYFPRSRWALIGFDDVAMVFARREAFPPAAIERLEFRTIDPEEKTIDGDDPERAAAEIERARAAGVRVGP
jgi:hypothetical protein